MEYIAKFLEWLKVALAKSTLFIIFGVLAAIFMSWIANMLLVKIPRFNEHLSCLDINNREYWLFLFITFMIIIIAIRVVEIVINILLIKKEEK
ncbi:hypothetical protein [Lacinutrix chionoecetis]